MRFRESPAFAGAVLLLVAAGGTAFAHGYAGKRFFPATITIEDPFVADELSLPTVSTFKEAGEGEEPPTRETEISVEFAKRITPKLGLSVEGGWTRLQPKGEPSVSGLNNFEVGIKYQFFKSDPRETILSAGVGVEIGGTGARRIAERFSTWTPSLFFGKGFGDLPDGWAAFKPFAATGVLGVTFPTRANTTTVTADPDTGDAETEVERHPHVLQWGFALEYSIPYLQSFVRDAGLRRPFNRMIPVVELAMNTPLDRGGGATTGTVNPGILWTGAYVQFGVEAIIPVNAHSGHNVGVQGQIHYYLDDLFPRSIGRPLLAAK